MASSASDRQSESPDHHAGVERVESHRSQAPGTDFWRLRRPHLVRLCCVMLSYVALSLFMSSPFPRTHVCILCLKRPPPDTEQLVEAEKYTGANFPTSPYHLLQFATFLAPGFAAICYISAPGQQICCWPGSFFASGQQLCCYCNFCTWPPQAPARKPLAAGREPHSPSPGSMASSAKSQVAGPRLQRPRSQVPVLVVGSSGRTLESKQKSNI